MLQSCYQTLQRPELNCVDMHAKHKTQQGNWNRSREMSGTSTSRYLKRIQKERMIGKEQGFSESEYDVNRSVFILNSVPL